MGGGGHEPHQETGDGHVHCRFQEETENRNPASGPELLEPEVEGFPHGIAEAPAGGTGKCTQEELEPGSEEGAGAPGCRRTALAAFKSRGTSRRPLGTEPFHRTPSVPSVSACRTTSRNRRTSDRATERPSSVMP
jgi:hypothetical protein